MRRYTELLPIGAKPKYIFASNVSIAYIDADMTVKTLITTKFYEMVFPLILDVDAKQLSKLLADIEADDEMMVDAGKERGIGAFRCREL